MTKVFEEVWRGTLEEAIEHFAQERPRGEFTLVIAGAEKAEPEAWDEERVKEALRQRLSEGKPGKEAVREVARLAAWPRRAVYRVWLATKTKEQDGPELTDSIR
jgi:16S rRNA (cytidine1402-2'-O)-methyltransferase